MRPSIRKVWVSTWLCSMPGHLIQCGCARGTEAYQAKVAFSLAILTTRKGELDDGVVTMMVTKVEIFK